jgi:hypothetical protein
MPRAQIAAIDKIAGGVGVGGGGRGSGHWRAFGRFQRGGHPRCQRRLEGALRAGAHDAQLHLELRQHGGELAQLIFDHRAWADIQRHAAIAEKTGRLLQPLGERAEHLVPTAAPNLDGDAVAASLNVDKLAASGLLVAIPGVRCSLSIGRNWRRLGIRRRTCRCSRDDWRRSWRRLRQKWRQVGSRWRRGWAARRTH